MKCELLSPSYSRYADKGKLGYLHRKQLFHKGLRAIHLNSSFMAVLLGQSAHANHVLSARPSPAGCRVIWSWNLRVVPAAVSALCKDRGAAQASRANRNG